MVTLLQVLVSTIATMARQSLGSNLLQLINYSRYCIFLSSTHIRSCRDKAVFAGINYVLTSSGDAGPAGPSLANTLTRFLLLIPATQVVEPSQSMSRTETVVIPYKWGKSY